MPHFLVLNMVFSIYDLLPCHSFFNPYAGRWWLIWPILIQNGAKTKWKLTETLKCGYLFESSQRELSNETKMTEFRCFSKSISFLCFGREKPEHQGSQIPVLMYILEGSWNYPLCTTRLRLSLDSGVTSWLPPFVHWGGLHWTFSLHDSNYWHCEAGGLGKHCTSVLTPSGCAQQKGLLSCRVPLCSFQLCIHSCDLVPAAYFISAIWHRLSSCDRYTTMHWWTVRVINTDWLDITVLLVSANSVADRSFERWLRYVH